MKVFVTSKSFGKYCPEAIDFLVRNGFELRWSKNINPDIDDIRNEIGDADVLIVGNDYVDGTVFDCASNLKLIHMNGTGLDAIDVEAATKRGIFVCNAPGGNRNAVAELTITLMLMVGRRPDLHQNLLRSGKWSRQPGHELSHSTVGVIGLGNIGRRVVELLYGFEPKFLGYDPYSDAEWAKAHDVDMVDSMDDVFSESDYIVLALPLLPSTERIVCDRTLALMKKNAYIINTARGGLIDEEALCRAVKEGNIAGAALDAFTTEPLPPDSPLLGVDNIILTPHLAATSMESSANVSMIVAKDIIKILKENTTGIAVNSKEILNARS